jgi:hypothetical protein
LQVDNPQVEDIRPLGADENYVDKTFRMGELKTEDLLGGDDTLVLAQATTAEPIASSPPPVAQRRLPVRNEMHPWLTLEQYAALRAAALAARDDAALADVRAGYGLDEQSDVAEVAAWSKRFEDPYVFADYVRIFTRLRGA